MYLHDCKMRLAPYAGFLERTRFCRFRDLVGVYFSLRPCGCAWRARQRTQKSHRRKAQQERLFTGRNAFTGTHHHCVVFEAKSFGWFQHTAVYTPIFSEEQLLPCAVCTFEVIQCSRHISREGLPPFGVIARGCSHKESKNGVSNIYFRTWYRRGHRTPNIGTYVSTKQPIAGGVKLHAVYILLQEYIQRSSGFHSL